MEVIGNIYENPRVEIEIKEIDRMKLDLNDLISRKRIRYELGESTMPKKYRDFCLRVIDSERLTPTVFLNFKTQEDLRNWVVDNWFTVEDCIGFALQTMIVDSKKDILNDIANREDAVEFISERVKEEILNVIDTYEVEGV